MTTNLTTSFRLIGRLQQTVGVHTISNLMSKLDINTAKNLIEFLTFKNDILKDFTRRTMT